MEIYNKSQLFNDQFVYDWNKSYTQNKSFMFGKKSPTPLSRYGHDVLYFIANALDVYDQQFNLSNYLNGNVPVRNFIKTVMGRVQH